MGLLCEAAAAKLRDLFNKAGGRRSIILPQRFRRKRRQMEAPRPGSHDLSLT